MDGSRIAPVPRMAPDSHEAGFTLVDAIIATAILAGAVLALARLLADASSLNVTARQATLSALLAAGTLEELRSRDNLVPGETGSEDVEPSGIVSAQGQGGYRAYTVRWSVAAMPNPELVRLSVAVDMRAGGGGQRITGRGTSLTTVRRGRRQ
jgi:type II secretory pathway pseudopilin PulG